jgi:hypothetical protein
MLMLLMLLMKLLMMKRPNATRIRAQNGLIVLATNTRLSTIQYLGGLMSTSGHQKDAHHFECSDFIITKSTVKFHSLQRVFGPNELFMFIEYTYYTEVDERVTRLHAVHHKHGACYADFVENRIYSEHSDILDKYVRILDINDVINEN